MTQEPGVVGAACWKALPANSRGTQAPPRPVRTNMRINDTATACSSDREQMRMRSPSAPTKADVEIVATAVANADSNCAYEYDRDIVAFTGACFSETLVRVLHVDRYRFLQDRPPLDHYWRRTSAAETFAVFLVHIVVCSLLRCKCQESLQRQTDKCSPVVCSTSCIPGSERTADFTQSRGSVSGLDGRYIPEHTVLHLDDDGGLDGVAIGVERCGSRNSLECDSTDGVTQLGTVSCARSP
jgi:hypothetical protein